MATLNILTPEELVTREQKPKGVGRGRRRSLKRSRIIEGFKEVLQQAKSGYGADVLLSEDEHKRTVRTNLKDAAGELGLALEFHPFSGPKETAATDSHNDTTPQFPLLLLPVGK